MAKIDTFVVVARRSDIPLTPWMFWRKTATGDKLKAMTQIIFKESLSSFGSCSLWQFQFLFYFEKDYMNGTTSNAQIK